MCPVPGTALPSSGERAALARRKRGAFVRKRSKASFDPKEFLAKVGEGKTISKYRKDQIVFSQGEVADAVFYIQQGKIKLTVVSEQGKEAVVAILGDRKSTRLNSSHSQISYAVFCLK